VPREMARTPSVEISAVPPIEAWNAAGISKDEIANANNEEAVCAAYRIRINVTGEKEGGYSHVEFLFFVP